MNWWTDFWTWVNDNQLAATVIGGLILAALFWGFARLPKVGPHVRYGLKWLWSWRPVTARRHKRELLNVYTILTAEVEGTAKVVAERAIADSADLEQAKKELARLMVEHRTANDDDSPWDKGVPTKLPAPEPRWKFYAVSDDDSEVRRYAIVNLVPGSVALNVRMDNSNYGGRFSFDDAAFWPDLSGEARGEFSGQITSTDENNRVRLRLAWLDENRATQTANFSIRGPEPEDESDVWGSYGSSDTPF